MNADPTRSPSGLNRRTALTGLGAGGLGLALAAATRPAAAQDATPAPMAGHPLVGTWIVDRNPADPTEQPTTNVITPDGGLIDPTVGAAGVWEATGERTANFTLTGFITEGGGGYFLVRGSVEIDAAGETGTVTYADLAVASDGTILSRSDGNTARYLRLRLVPPDAELQPLAGFPAWTPAPAATPEP